MLSISKRSIFHAVAAVSVIFCTIWISFEPGFKSCGAFLATLAFFIGSLFVSDHRSSPTSEKTKSAREERNRKGMLELVRNSWVEGVLEQSLHEAVLIKLGLEEQRGAVCNRQGIELQTPSKPNRLLPPGTEIVDVFDEMGQTLLILGEPGSGKTTMLLELARDTIARAEEDPKHPIPVVFNLSSWMDAKQPIADWLVGELDTKYYTPKKIASDWIENDDLLLLLDGLDEVSSEHREACTRAINVFRREHGWTPLAVCCRIEEYEALTDRLGLKGAVSLQPLTEEQVDDYLDRIGQELAALRAALKDDTILYELAQTPLMLSIMTLAYHGMSVHELQPLETVDARRKHIFDSYVERMFKPRIHRTIPEVSDDPRPDDERFSKEKTIHWLSWLARRMSEHGQTIFLIEKLQPDWLSTRVQQRIVTVGVAVMIWLTLLMLYGLLPEPCIGLFILLLTALLAAQSGYSKDIKPVETLRFLWPAMRTLRRCGHLLLLGIIFALLSWRFVGMLSELFAVISVGLILSLLPALLSSIIRGEIGTRRAPNEGIHRSARNALFMGLLFVVPLFLLFHFLTDERYSGLILSLFIGLIFGLEYGGRACIQHLILRIMLWRNGSALG